MRIFLAASTDFPAVKDITQATIGAVYPRYYPAGAVDFFRRHHSDGRIRADIAAGKVFLLSDGGAAVGTVTVDGDEIRRLFVLPEHQRKGFGKALLGFAEREILSAHDAIRIDASLPAKGLYLKRGYRETEYHTIVADNGDRLCYDVMILRREEAARDGEVLP